MNSLSPLLFIPPFIMAFLSLHIISFFYKTPKKIGNYETIDGLRGYLAFLVFIHHAMIWYFYIQTNHWVLPSSNIYTNFGQMSVALFFMITAFLFSSKLIREKKIDWLHLFTSRFLRLTPLYFLAIFLLFIIIAIQSNFTLNVSLIELILSIVSWLSFTFLGSPNINGIDHTFTILAGVTWSLPYEWFFYLSLPLLGMALSIKANKYIVIFITIGSFILFFWKPEFYKLISFLGGIVTAFASKSIKFCNIAKSKFSSLAILIFTPMAFTFFSTAYNLSSLTLLTIIFSLIACGNNLWGVFTSKISYLLGEIAYSIYLLHGLLIYITIKVIISNQLLSITPINYWLVITSITPVLLVCCIITFKYIEKPSIEATTNITHWLKLNLIKIKENHNFINKTA